MKQKDKFLLLMVLSCLPLGNAVAEQTGAGLYSPINQEVLQNTVKITGQVIDPFPVRWKFPLPIIKEK